MERAISTTISILALLSVLIWVAVAQEKAIRDAPSPYAQCAKKATRAEQRQCERTVHFALGFGD